MCQGRENLRVYGICEEGTDEDTKETLYNILETGSGIDDARRIEFQRVHRVGKQNGNPRELTAIIARFLRYPDREAVFSRRWTILLPLPLALPLPLPYQTFVTAF